MIQVDEIGFAIGLVAADKVAVRGLLPPIGDAVQGLEVQPP
jgi:hypothetical protein